MQSIEIRELIPAKILFRNLFYTSIGIAPKIAVKYYEKLTTDWKTPP
jgi:hypothetical protein